MNKFILFHFDIDHGWTFKVSWDDLRLKFAFFVNRRATAVTLVCCHVCHLLMMRMDAVWWWMWHSLDLHFMFAQQITRWQCVIRRRNWTVCGWRVHFNHGLTLRYTYIWLQVICGTSIVHCRIWCTAGENWRRNLSSKRAWWQWRCLITVHLGHRTINRWWRILGMYNCRCDRLMKCSAQITQF